MLKTTLIGLCCFLILIIGLLFSLQYKPVQSYFGKIAANYLAKELSAEISIGGLYVKPFSSLQIQHLFVSDLQGDTLLYAPEMQASFDLKQLLQSQATIYDINLKDAVFNLKKDENGVTNLSFLIAYFKNRSEDQSKRRKINLDLKHIQFQNLSFEYRNLAPTTNQLLKLDRQIDFNTLKASKISGELSEITFSEGQIGLDINHFSLTEKSGFTIKQLKAKAIFDQHYIDLQDLYLQTNRSEIGPSLRLSYDKFADFKDFMNKVEIQLALDQARISSKDIAYFAADLEEILFEVNISGKLSGYINNFKGQAIDMRTAEKTQLIGDISIVGLPEINQTIFDINLQQLNTSAADIETLVQELSKKDSFALPELLHRLGSLDYAGQFNGNYNNFFVEGKLKTELGEVNTALGIDFQQGPIAYQGEIDAPEFDLGSMLLNPQFGYASFNTFVDGENFQLEDLQIQADGLIENLDFRGYTYKNILLNGSINEQQLVLAVEAEDPNLQFKADGSLDLRPNSLENDFWAIITHADITALQLYSKKQLSIKDAVLKSKFSGQSMNDLEGEVSVQNLSFELGNQHYRLENIKLLANGALENREIRLESDLLNAQAIGHIDVEHLPSYFKALSNQHIPSFAWDVGKSGQQDFKLSLEAKNLNLLLSFFENNLYIGDGGTFEGNFTENPAADKRHISFRADIPELSWGALTAKQISILQEENADNSILFTIASKALKLNGIEQELEFQSKNLLKNNELQYQFNFSDSNQLHQAKLLGKATIKGVGLMDIHPAASQLILNQEEWQISRGLIQLTNEKLRIGDISFSNKNQRIQISGIISDLPEEQLRIQFNRFDLRTISPFIPNINFRLGGQINGKTEISAVLNKPYAVADLSLNSITMDELEVGDVKVDANFDPDRNLVNLAIDLNKDRVQTLFIGGTYHINLQENQLNLLARFNQTDLRVTQVLLKDLIQDVSGTLSGQAQLTGKINQINLTGNGQLNHVGFTVSYLNTPYRIEGPIRMQNSVFLLENNELLDPRNQRAQLSGKVDLNNIRNPLIQASIQATNFLVLNTTFANNDLYFGTAYGTGKFDFYGTPKEMNIDIQARTEESTVFNIPLNASNTLGDNEFIRFVAFNPYDLETTKNPASDKGDFEKQNELLKGLKMNMDLHVTNGSTVNIQTDLGELSGRGDGQLDLRISSLGDFEMFGDYQINSGKFTFTAQDFINKIFEIKPGGNIRWTGKPMDANISMIAFYEQRTSLSPLYNAAGRTANEQRVLARAEMSLTGNLLRPGINFGLGFPADPYVKDELQAYLSDANNVNQQALSLIVRRSFIPGSTSELGKELNSTILSAGTELAFNQLNTLISQSLNLNFIDLNIRSLNDASASFRFFNDRLVFTGGVTDLREQRLNDLNVFSDRIATDAELLYLIRKDGRLVLRGSNRLNTRHFLLNPTDEYISALGLIYRQEFNTFGEFFNNIFLIKKRVDSK